MMKLSQTDLINMSEHFHDSEDFDLSEARLFVKNVIPEEIQDPELREGYACTLYEIILKTAALKKYKVCARALIKAYRLAPQLEEVRMVVTSLGVTPKLMDEKKLAKHIERKENM